MKIAKADGITPQVLRTCYSLCFHIFNLSLSLCVVPNCYKKSIIIPVLKKMTTTCMNDLRPVALTSMIMKCFEQLVKAYINNCIPVSTDPLESNRTKAGIHMSGCYSLITALPSVPSDLLF